MVEVLFVEGAPLCNSKVAPLIWRAWVESQKQPNHNTGIRL